MASSEPIDYKQIAKPNLLEPLRQEIKATDEALNALENTLKSSIAEAANLAKTTPLNSFANLEKVEGGLSNVTKLVEELTAVEKQRADLAKQMVGIEASITAQQKNTVDAIVKINKASAQKDKQDKKLLNNYEKLLKEQKAQEKELLRLTTVFGKNSDIVEEARVKYNELTERVKDINSVRKEEQKQISKTEKLQQQLNSLTSETAKDEFELKEQIRLRTKELRDAAKANAESADAYEDLKKRTNAAQLELKKLAAQYGANSKQAEEARKTFEALDEELREVNDAARDGRRDVGRYEKGVKSLNKTLKVFASATIVLKVLQLLQTSLSKNSEGTAELEKLWVRVTAVFQVAAERISNVFPILVAKFQRFVLNVRIGAAEITNIFGGNAKEVQKLRDEYDSLEKTASGDLAGAFKGFGEDVEDLTGKQIKLIDDTLDYRREIVGLEKDIAKLIPTQEKLRAQFEDDSTSLEEQIVAGVAFRAELENRQKLEESIAARRLRLAQENAAANTTSVEAQEELSAATKEYAQLVADQAAELTSTERDLQKLRDDATQLNLDFYIDDLDNRKTVNERIIADETQTFEHRRALLNENLSSSEEGFRLEEEALNKSLRERGKAELDFEELRKSNSSEEIARIVRESGVSEPIAIRALEVLRERRTFLQDNAEAQRDLNQSEAESRALQDDIILQKRTLLALDKKGVDTSKILQELAEARLQNEVDNLRSRIEVAKKGSAEFIRLNKELNDKLIEQEQARDDKRKKLAADFGKAAEGAFDILADIGDKRTEARLSAIDKEIAAEEKRINRLQELADQGNEDAENNLAVANQRQAQLELERERQLVRQKKSELALTAIQTYSGKVSSGTPNPLASTISDISVLRAFVDALPGFFEGTEDTGTKGLLKDRHGAITGFTHANERVIDAGKNRLIGNMSNTELTMLAHRENTRSTEQHLSNQVLNELRYLRRVTQDKPVYLGTDVDPITDFAVSKVQRGNRLDRIHKKTGGIWGHKS